MWLSLLRTFEYIVSISVMHIKDVFVFRLKLLWLTLTRVHTACEIEFLPVYVPNEQEKQDPKLYASNVRNVMAK